MASFKYRSAGFSLGGSPSATTQPLPIQAAVAGNPAAGPFLGLSPLITLRSLGSFALEDNAGIALLDNLASNAVSAAFLHLHSTYDAPMFYS